ncbi:glycosyltransferase family 2 protein [Aquabacterium sp.]|uniref:glycosyltransferase family 2 protein n=1 Tax=Aquabacterium sp. TaxID=1872578 RepID=UPI003D6D9810
MSTKIAIITMVKDECDIIELFVKVNSRSVDHIFVLDHNSQDGTQQILLAMQAHGYPLTIFKHESADFQQAVLLSTLARKVAATNVYDFIIPLDGDEFIHTPEGTLAEVLNEQIPADGSGLLPWVTYIPTHGDYLTAKAPLYEVFRKRSKEPDQVYKVVIRNEHAKNCVIAEGNHWVFIDGEMVEGTVLTSVLQHVPVRSVEQIKAKALLGSRRLSIKVGRHKEEQGVHWDRMAEKIRAADYHLSPEEMLNMAFLYVAKPHQESDELSIDEDAPRIGLAKDEIELRDMSRINLTKKFDQFMGDLCAELRKVRGIGDDQ